MPFVRPTLLELVERIAADIESRLPGVDARLRRSNAAVLARVLGGATHGLHGNLEFLAGQIFPDTAEKEYLERWASIWSVLRKPAAAGQGSVIFTGTNGTVIPAGTLLQRSDGAEYTVDADATIAAGSATAAVTAGQAGAAGNTAAGSALSLVNPLAGVNASATVAAGGVTGGADAELDEDLRGRLLARIRQPPHGGADFDYVAWALEVPGVTRAWCYPRYLGNGTVGVAFVCDDQPGGIIPDAAKVSEVQDYLDFLRPVTADLTVFAPVARPLDLTIRIAPDSAAVRAAVTAELADLVTRTAVPNGTIYLSHIREAISVAAGELDHTLVAPVADVVCSGGEISIMGAITWQ